MKKFLYLLTLIILMVGCSNEDANTKNGSGEVANKNTQESQKEVQQIEKKTPEEYLEEFKKTTEYQEIKSEDIAFNEVVDFEGDELPEIVLGVNSDVIQSEVLIFKLQNEVWEKASSFTYDTSLAIRLEQNVKFTYDDSVKEAFAFETVEAYANTMSSSVVILNYNNETATFEELANIKLQSTDTLNLSLGNNKFNVIGESDTLKYNFKNGELVDDEGKRIGLIIDDELAKLIGTTINNYFITYGDSYYTAQEKITEPLEQETYYEGGLCSFYSSFFICNSDHQGLIYAYYITPTNMVTVEDLSRFFNQSIDIIETENMIDDSGTFYSSEIVTDIGTYQLEFNGNSPQAELEMIIFIPS